MILSKLMQRTVSSQETVRCILVFYIRQYTEFIRRCGARC